MFNQVKTSVLSLFCLSLALATLPLTERLEGQLKERSAKRDALVQANSYQSDYFKREEGAYTLVDYKFTELDTSKLGTPFANRSSNPGSAAGELGAPQSSSPSSGTISPPPISNDLESNHGANATPPKAVSPSPLTGSESQSSSGGNAEPQPADLRKAPEELPADQNANEGKNSLGKLGNFLGKMGVPASQAARAGVGQPYVPYVPYVPGTPYVQYGAGAANSILNGAFNGTNSGTTGGYVPLHAGPPANMAVAPGVQIQNGTAEPLSDYNSPKRPGQHWSPYGKSIDQTVQDSAWQRAKQRDAQGVSGIAPAHAPSSLGVSSSGKGSDSPPVNEDKEPKTPDEMARLAYWYWKNWRVSKLPLAVDLMTKSAEAGDRSAQSILADWYERGIRDTLQPDESKTFYWYSKAAAQNQRVAETWMGLYYSEGRLTAKNPRKSFEYFQKAANQHYAPAEMAVAQSYCCGDGVAENRALAIQWFETAQADGSNTAKDFLEVLRLPHCPAHFSSLDELLAYGTRYQGLQASRMMSQSQQAVGRVKMIQNTPGSTEYRLGRRIYNNGQQNADNANSQLNSQF